MAPVEVVWEAGWVVGGAAMAGSTPPAEKHSLSVTWKKEFVASGSYLGTS